MNEVPVYCIKLRNRSLFSLQIRKLFLLLILGGADFFSARGQAEDSYEKVSDSKDVVKDKLFPKKSRLELNIPDVGIIMNQSYINTILIHGGINYYPAEHYGFGVEAAFGLNSDKPERECIESFYLDPTNGDVPNVCGSEGDPASDLGGSTGAKYGPAYVPIREINTLLMANYIWTPVYGKQLFFLRATGYFDLFFTAGGGLAMSSYYPKRDTLRNGKKARDEAVQDGTTKKIPDDVGADASETGSYGTEGRPDPIAETHPLINLGIGQRFHFMKRFNVKVELRNLTLIGTESGFDNLFAIWGGLGVRF